MSEEQDPLAALSAAAKTPGQPRRRPFKGRAPAAPASQYADPSRIRYPSQKRSPVPTIIISAFTFLIGLGVGILIMVLVHKSAQLNPAPTPEPEHVAAPRVPSKPLPGELFGKVKSQDPNQ